MMLQLNQQIHRLHPHHRQSRGQQLKLEAVRDSFCQQKAAEFQKSRTIASSVAFQLKKVSANGFITKFNDFFLTAGIS
jgi:hypothetical protein